MLQKKRQHHDMTNENTGVNNIVKSRNLKTNKATKTFYAIK